jgi:hypothetical protein
VRMLSIVLEGISWVSREESKAGFQKRRRRLGSKEKMKLKVKTGDEAACPSRLMSWFQTRNNPHYIPNSPTISSLYAKDLTHLTMSYHIPPPPTTTITGTWLTTSIENRTPKTTIRGLCSDIRVAKEALGIPSRRTESCRCLWYHDLEG